MSTRALVFDAYGTLFDVRAVGEACAAVTPNPEAFVALWRAKQLEYAFLRALMRRYADFWSVTRDALRFAAGATNTPLTAAQEEAVLEAWYRVAPFSDVEPALRALKSRGVTLAILSNGTPAMLARLVEATGLAEYFGALLSVDAVQSYKPDPIVYALPEQVLALPREELLFVSSNFWDVAGARAFGLRVCWINRSGAQPDVLGQQPTYSLDSMAGLPEVAAY
ncbi:MAG TPA: haloacid dehalogenase type II [Roseiflexaceae bacterium]|nr:haloacid dehalogenase type II [Roseiflexaceae bacterium]